jgi:hypothetical protein
VVQRAAGLRASAPETRRSSTISASGSVAAAGYAADALLAWHQERFAVRIEDARAGCSFDHSKPWIEAFAGAFALLAYHQFFRSFFEWEFGERATDEATGPSWRPQTHSARIFPEKRDSHFWK